MWETLETGTQWAIIVAGVIVLAVLIGFVMHWARLWKIRRKR
jgi:hypothetical protein